MLMGWLEREGDECAVDSVEDDDADDKESSDLELA